MERITIDLPIVKVKVSDNYLGSDYAKEHYEAGLFLIDDGISQIFVVYDGVSSVWSLPCPTRLVQDVVGQENAKRERERCADVLEGINDRLSQIARMVGECRDKCDGVINNFVEVRDDLIDTIDEKFSGLPRSVSEGVNILDVARAAAVIQKPELIKELNK